MIVQHIPLLFSFLFVVIFLRKKNSLQKFPALTQSCKHEIFLPGPFDEVRQVVEETEGVERVTDDFCDGPGCDEQQHAVLTLHLHTHTHT